MEDILLVSLALALLALGPLLGLIALIRTLRFGAVERRLRDLEAAVRSAPPPGARSEPARPTPGPPRPADAPAPAAPIAPRPAAPVSPGPPAPPRTAQIQPLPLPPAPSGPPAPERAPAKPRKIEWERWIGVRGAAAAGGAVLALAVILFFKYAFERGLIEPWMRVAIGVATGVACILAGERLHPRGYRFAPGALQGAGVVALYAAIWAAHKRYAMISLPVSFPLMAAVTGLCCFLALRHRERLSAVLGLVGGFATPLLLSSGEDRPIALFGYVLLLDLGLLFVGRRSGWAWLGLLALLGTIGMEALWVGRHLTPERLTLALVILGVFALVFAFQRMAKASSDEQRWLPSRVGAVLFPFAFAIYFAGRVELGPHIAPIALLMALLAAAACRLGREPGAAWLPAGASSAAVAVLAVWVLQIDSFTEALAWELVGAAVGLALVPCAAAELARRRPQSGECARSIRPELRAAALGAAGMIALAAYGASIESPVPLWPWLAGLGALAALLARQAALGASRLPLLAAGLGLGVGLSAYQLQHLGNLGHPTPDARFFAGLLVAISLAFLGLGSLLRRGPLARANVHAQGLWSLAIALPLLDSWLVHQHRPWLELGLFALLGLALAVEASRARSGAWFAIALLATWIGHCSWAIDVLPSSGGLVGAGQALLLLAGAAALFAWWPLLAGAHLSESRAFRRIAAFAAALWWFPIYAAWIDRYQDDHPIVPALGCALLAAIPALAAELQARRSADARERARLPATTMLAWHGAAAIALASLAIALEADFEEGALTLGLCALGVAALARHASRAGLAWISAASAAVCALALCAGAVEVYHYERETALLWNRFAWAFLVPAAATFAATALLGRPAADGRSFQPWPRAVTAFAGLAIVFAWINVSLLNAWSTEERLSFHFARVPARDLSISIAWTLYAVVILGFGMAKKSAALRWISLALLLATLAKVFLYDLGELKNLYRVGSLAGLALSLIGVSLLYQRFVFRREPPRSEPAV